MKRYRRRSVYRISTGIFLTPLLDAAFCLLIVAVCFISAPRQAMPISYAEHLREPSEGSETTISVHLEADGSLTEDGQTILAKQLPERLVNRGIISPVCLVIEADAAVACGQLIATISQLADLSCVHSLRVGTDREPVSPSILSG